jgi:acetoin utilization deacetylase AcuC-like enzyme
MHPESPARVEAVIDGIRRADLGDDLEWVEPRPATVEELALVHEAGYVDAVRRYCERGGGKMTLDTGAGAGSWEAALYAAGAALTAVEKGGHAFCAVRPPGHHANRAAPMGFCLFNNVAVCAKALADQGERVLIVDWDVHHGNGTQDMFYDDDRVLYVSWHQAFFYPFTGELEETGEGAGEGYTINFPLPRGATGDVYRTALDEVVAPAAAEFGPTRVLVSSGFDSHRDDSLEGTDLGLTAGDFATLTERCAALTDAGLVILLEGGYDIDALAASAQACVTALAGQREAKGEVEQPTSGGPGMDVVEAAARLRA